MFPQLYQKVFETHLNPRQYLTLQLLVLMLQSYRDVSLSTLANKFPQLIKYESRVRNLQRFLDLPQLTAKLLWFPLIKQLVKQEFRHQPSNRQQRRRIKKLQLIHQGHLFLIIDRTQWQERNLIVLSLAWGKHAIPVYWEILPKKESSNLREQKKVLTPVLRLLKPYPVLVLADA
jgi:hypothetical protein